jgi:hypothetical protein
MESRENETKRQHYVPQTYLKHFSFKKGKEYYVHALSQDTCNKNDIKELNIKNVCLENGIYKLPFENTRDRMLFERFFSNEVESHYDKIYKILINANKKNITEEERALIITTVVTMFFRTAFWKNIMNNLREKSFETAYDLCKQYDRDYFYYKNIKISITGKTFEELKNEYKIKENVLFLLTQLNAMVTLFDSWFLNDDICLIRIVGENEFITSDNPVIAFNKGIVIPLNPENTMFLPIDNKHILCLLPNSNKMGRLTIFRRNVIDIKEIEEYNSMQKQCCERFVLGSKCALLKIRNL